MKSPELKTGSELNEIEEEFGKAQDFIEENLSYLDDIIEKYEFLNDKHQQTNDLWYTGKMQDLYNHLKLFYKDIDYDKIEESDKSGITKILANIVKQIEINSINTTLKKIYGKYSRERKLEEKQELLKEVESLKKEKKFIENKDYTKEIISRKEESMTNRNPDNSNPRRGGKLPETIEAESKARMNEIDAKNKAEIEKAKELSKIKIKEKKKEAKIENKKKEKVDDKTLISDIAEKEANGITLSSDEENLKIKHPILYKKELKKHLDNLEDPDEIASNIAIAEIEGKKLSGSENKFVSGVANRNKVDNLKNKIDSIAKRLAKGEKATKFLRDDKEFYKKYKGTIDSQAEEFGDLGEEAKQNLINTLAEKIASETTLDPAEEADFRKHEKEILDLAGEKLKNNKEAVKVRREIAIAELDHVGPPPVDLTPEQEMRTRIPSERVLIDKEKTNITGERAEYDRIASLLFATPNIVLLPEQKKIYDANKDLIDAKVVELKEADLKAKKDKIIDEKSNGRNLNDVQTALYNEHKAELDPIILENLKKSYEDAKAANNFTDMQNYEIYIKAHVRDSEKARTAYKPLADRLARTLNSDKYKELVDKNTKAPGTLDPAENTLLEQYNKEIKETENALNAVGPSGKLFADLEVQRANLAKASQEFQSSFVRKFPMAKVVGVIGGMFGAKWSAMKEGDKTAAAKSAMDNTQIEYDKVRRNLMNTLVEEEHTVRKTLGQDFKNLGVADKYSLESFIGKVNKEFVEDEHKKLDDMKHVLEGTVRGSAMRRWGEWNSKGGIFKNVENPVHRKLLHRASMAIMLGVPISIAGSAVIAGALSLTGVATASAALTSITPSMVGYRLLRGVCGGVAGESAAMLYARVRGGKLNKEGELENLVSDRDKEIKLDREKFTKEMMTSFAIDVKPEVSSDMMNQIRNDHKKTVDNYMNRQGKIRRGELWVRLATGGLTAYGLSHVMPGADSITDTTPDQGTPKPEVAPIVTPEPGVEDLELRGVSVDASSKGSIQTFMNLKEKMLDQYESDPRFAGLDREAMAQKMISEGNMDPFVEEIMGAKSYADFAEVAKDHGFWKLSGVGNPEVDSASVPAGSTIGFRTPDGGGDLYYYIKTPNGQEIKITDFADQASGKFGGVNLIDTTVPKPSGIDTGAGNGNGELPPDSLLGPEEYTQGDPITPVTESDLSGGQTESSNGVSDAGNSTETVPAPAPTGLDDASFYKSIKNPGNEHDYYTNKYGFESKGKMTYMPGTAEDPTTEYYDKAGNYFYTEQYSGYNKIAGGPHDIKNSPMYREYHALKNNYDTAQQELIKLETAKLNAARASADNAYNNMPGQSTNNPAVDPEVLQAREIAIKQNTTEIANNWVDDTFGRGDEDSSLQRMLGIHKKGIETKAWANLKNDKVLDLVNDSKTPSGDDVYGGSKLSNKESEFLGVLINKSQQYGLNPDTNETVESFTQRLAAAEARTKLVAGSR